MWPKHLGLTMAATVVVSVALPNSSLAPRGLTGSGNAKRIEASGRLGKGSQDLQVIEVMH